MKIPWTLERLLSKTSPEPTSGCWLWTGSVFPNGYGQAGRGRDMYAHRIAFRLRHGSDAEHCVCHRCDQPSCVNPDHLFEGTVADNARDRCAKNRGARGESHGAARLSAQDVQHIRMAVALGAMQKSLAARFGVSATMVNQIVKRRAWKHVA